MTGLLAFDRTRLEALRMALEDALDDLRGIRSDDIEAAEVMRSVRRACRTLGDLHLSRVHDVLTSDVMTSYRPNGIDVEALAREQPYSTAHDRSWEPVDPRYASSWFAGPTVPTVDDVLARVHTGELVPMAAPLDADGRANAHFTSLAIAAPRAVSIGTVDQTSNLSKVLDFVSDGLPVGWHEHEELQVLYIPDARVTRSVHTLTTVDPHSGLPETLDDLTTQAVVPGFLILETGAATLDVSLGIGPDIQDPTQSWALITQSAQSYSGVFYPLATPDFEPLADEPRVESPPIWTFTTSSAPVGDGWGTWGL